MKNFLNVCDVRVYRVSALLAALYRVRSTSNVYDVSKLQKILITNASVDAFLNLKNLSSF